MIADSRFVTVSCGLSVLVGPRRDSLAWQRSSPHISRDARAARQSLGASHASHVSAGYDITDEPGRASFPAIAAVVGGLAMRDPKHFAYVNLFPDYAPASALGTPTYDAYVG